MKRILYLTLTIMLCLTFFTAVTWAEEKASAASDKILSQQQVDELLQADDNPAAYVKIDEDAYKVYPDFKDKKAVRKELLKNLPTNKVLYLLTASEQTFTLAFDVVKDLEKSGRLYDNSLYMGGKDDSDAGAENIKANIHKFWFMKKHSSKKQYFSFLIYFFGFRAWMVIGGILYRQKSKEILPSIISFLKGIRDGILT